jgi:mandelate racemase
MTDTTQLIVEKIEIRLANVPMRRPIVSAVGQYDFWPFLLLDIYTDQGVVGHSYLEFYVLDSAKYIIPAVRKLADTLIGKPVAPTQTFDAAIAQSHLHGRQGVSLIAASAIDMALWDAHAKGAGVPLAVMLGGTVGPVRAYNTNGLWLIPLDRLAEQAAELVAEGNFNAIKIRLGRERLEDDLRAIAEVRRAVAPDVEIMSDFNQGLRPGDALRRLHALDGQGLYWFEEPIVFDDYRQCAQLAARMKTPIQTGENIYGPRDFYNAVQNGAASLYMPDLMRIGGVTGFMRAGAIAGAANVPISSHLYPEFSAHILRVCETADWVEWRDWGNPLLQEPFDVENGQVIVPDRPGAGIEWNEDAVARFGVALD